MKEITKTVELYIVIADDDIDDHELIKKAIKECDLNYIVTSVYNGAQLMNLLRKKGFYKTEFSRNPEVILLDLRMPIMNGMEALKQIKSDPELKNIPVFILSDSDSEEGIKMAERMGAEKFFTKPFSYNELRELMRDICSEIHQQKKAGT